MPIAYYASAVSSSNGSPAQRTWGNIQRMLADFSAPRKDPKALNAAWAPHTFKSGTERKASNIAHVTALVFDFDTPGDSVDKVINLPSVERYERLAHSTYSSVQGAEKSRLILPLGEPVPGHLWSAVYRKACEVVGLVADTKCSDPSRLYFLPCSGPHQAAARRMGDLLSLRELVQSVELDQARLEIERQRRRAEAARAAQYADRSDRAYAKLLATSPDARFEAAVDLGAVIVEGSQGRLARFVLCPSCSQKSVWFPIDNVRASGAFCNHKNSCGWSGPLTALVGRR